MHGRGSVTYPPASKKGEMVLGDKFKGVVGDDLLLKLFQASFSLEFV